jgi:outer membrane protein assembly factor BamB
VAFQQDRILMALDPVSGDTLWIRDDMQRGSDLFGDRRRLLVTPAGSHEAVVLSALDGRTLGRRKVPPRNKRLGTCGHSVVLWEPNETATELKLFDPWQQSVVWRHQFDRSAKPWMMKGGQVGVLEAEGRFVAVSADSGRIILESSVDPLPELHSLFAQFDGSHYLLIASRPVSKPEGPVGWNRLPQGQVPVNGFVYQLDAKSGQTLWKTDVQNQRLKMDYPSRAPVLTFFKQQRKAVRHGKTGWRTGQPVVLLECLDTRTGKRLHSGKVANDHSTTYTMTVDPVKHRVDIESRSEKLSLVFSEAKQPEER